MVAKTEGVKPQGNLSFFSQKGQLERHSALKKKKSFCTVLMWSEEIRMVSGAVGRPTDAAEIGSVVQDRGSL